MSSPSSAIQNCIDQKNASASSGPSTRGGLNSNACNCVYNFYGGRAPANAALIGVFSGIAGLAGLGGFWHATSSDSLTQATKDFSSVKAAWTERYKTEESNVKKILDSLNNEVLELEAVINKYNEEVIKEDIVKNTLLIQILAGVTLIIIIYLIIL